MRPKKRANIEHMAIAFGYMHIDLSYYSYLYVTLLGVGFIGVQQAS